MLPDLYLYAGSEVVMAESIWDNTLERVTMAIYAETTSDPAYD